MPDNTNPFQWLGWGAVAVVLYLLVSNSLYLLVGARLLQYLPGVHVEGFRGTIRLALLLVITIVATLWWLFKWPLVRIGGREARPWRDELATRIHFVAKVSNRIADIAARRVTSR